MVKVYELFIRPSCVFHTCLEVNYNLCDQTMSSGIDSSTLCALNFSIRPIFACSTACHADCLREMVSAKPQLCGWNLILVSELHYLQ